MPKIEKTKTGYRARVSTGERLPSGGYRYISLSAATKAEVRRMIASFDENREKALSAHLAGRVTLSQAMDQYLDTCRAVNRSPATLRGYVSMRNNGFEPLLDKPIAQITSADIQALVNGWVAAGASPKTIDNKRGFLSASMKAAGVNPPFENVLFPEQTDDEEIVIPEDDDVQRVMAYTREHMPDMYLAIVLAATLGLRRSEIAALTMEDIDFDNRLVSVRRARVVGEGNELYTKSTKSRKGKRILYGISPLVLDVIRQYGHQPPEGVTGKTPAAITDSYMRLRDKLGLPGCFHDLRHYSASVMAALSVPEKYAMDRIGHATKGLLNRVYQHTFKRKTDVVADSLAAHDFVILSGGKYDYSENPAANYDTATSEVK